MKRILLAATLVVVLVLARSATGAFSASAKPKDGAGNRLVGTWLTTVTLTNPPPGVDATFQALDTFVPGGGILVSSSQSHPTARSLAHGNCARTGGHQYSCTFVWFRFDPTGAYLGMQRVRRTMTVSQDGNSFESTDTVEVLAPNGAVVATLQGSETGQRLGA
jgi:hypothetical protein